MCWLHFAFTNFKGILVCGLAVVHYGCKLVFGMICLWLKCVGEEGRERERERLLVLTVASLAGCNFCQISVIIALHFQVEDFAFWIAGFGNEEFVQESLEAGER